VTIINGYAQSLFLSKPMFRNLLIADLVSDIGTFDGVGATVLPARAALGDIFDRRKLIVITEVWMLSVAVALAALTLLHWITPWMLLLLTLALSIGDALEAPTWRAVLPEVVPREDLLPAIALNGIEFNLARAIGPALGGFLIAVAGKGLSWLQWNMKLRRNMRTSSLRRSRNSPACGGAMVRRTGEFITIPNIRRAISKRLSWIRGLSTCDSTRD
jgi:MFS family permease